MPYCKADPSIERQDLGGFKFPLGSYPIEAMTPKAGYTLQFEPADGGEEEGDWEEWPDRYIFDVVVSAERVEPLCRMLFAALPGRVYPILDILGHDAYREIDPYISYDLVGVDRFMDGLRRYRDFLFEDGMVGFGAMAEEPFLYVFVDEHKIVTIRAEPDLKERVERVLHAFDLEETKDPAGADAAAHEHRTVLVDPAKDPESLTPDEIVERLRDEWQLLLNVDPDGNVDDDGKPLGATLWRCILRCEIENKPSKYAEIILRAKSLREAEDTAIDALDRLAGDVASDLSDVFVVSSDRVKPEQVGPIKTQSKPSKSGGGAVIASRWLEP